jgi:GT2 family glycosyltransferase
VLPPGVTPHDLDQACEHWSFGDLFPRVPLVHGFCFGIKKTVIDRIGLFDDQNFQRYFGEENDYCFRAAEAGFDLSIATNTFVFHRKSRSIEEEERIVHMAQAGQRLRDLYGINRIQVACSQVEHHPLLLRIRLTAKEYFNMAASNRKTSPRELQFRALKKA